MPMIDMPLSELEKYQGRNPRPADFDEYWERALTEMRAVNANVELIPAAFQVPNTECFHLYFTGVRGSRIHAKYLRPKGKTSVPAVLCFHGYAGNTGDWAQRMAFVNCGFAVAMLDCRGQFGLSEDLASQKGTTYQGHVVRGAQSDSPDDLAFRQIFLDTAQLADIVMGFPEIDAENVCAMGSSQGGALTIACAALEPRIRKIAPAIPFLSDFKRVWEMDMGGDAYLELKQHFLFYDPLHEQEEAFFTRLGYIDIQNLAPRIQSEVLWAMALMDTICPPSTQFAAYNKITAKKEILFYPDYGHGELPQFIDKTMQFFLK